MNRILRTSNRHAVGRGGMLVGVLVAGWVATAPAAVGHAELIEANPTQGAVLTELPAEITLVLNEDVQEPAFVAVTDPEGRQVAGSTVTVDGPRVTAPIEPTDTPGRYTVAYRIVSTDSHVVTGESTFEVTAPAAITSTPTPEPAATPRVTSTPGIPGGDDSSTTMILTISGFTVLAMIGLVLLLRTGLRSRDIED